MNQNKPNVVIIIPTYNERDVIAKTIDDLQYEFKKINDHEMNILIFDSQSPDGTIDIVKQKQQQFDNLHLETEPKKSGLGGAYIKAMQYAIQSLKADIVFEFDADGSHQPHHIPTMLQALSKGADVVVGSRFVDGGSIPKDWGLSRKLLSTLGNWLSRLVLSNQYKDYTSGFRATRTSFLKKIDLNALLSKGYAYKIHLFWELHLAGANIVECPIDFIDREIGYSKLPKSNAIESLYLIFRLRARTFKRYLTVCIVGLSGALVQFVIFNILRHWLSPVYANAIGIEFAIINNFLMNNHFSFSDRKIHRSQELPKFLKKFGLFNLFCLSSALIQSLVVLIGEHLFGRGLLEENLFVFVGIVFASIYNFLMYSHFIWIKKTSLLTEEDSNMQVNTD